LYSLSLVLSNNCPVILTSAPNSNTLSLQKTARYTKKLSYHQLNSIQDVLFCPLRWPKELGYPL
jgi:hypothetical protein